MQSTSYNTQPPLVNYSELAVITTPLQIFTVAIPNGHSDNVSQAVELPQRQSPTVIDLCSDSDSMENSEDRGRKKNASDKQGKRLSTASNLKPESSPTKKMCHAKINIPTKSDVPSKSHIKEVMTQTICSNNSLPPKKRAQPKIGPKSKVRKDDDSDAELVIDEDREEDEDEEEEGVETVLNQSEFISDYNCEVILKKCSISMSIKDKQLADKSAPTPPKKCKRCLSCLSMEIKSLKKDNVEWKKNIWLMMNKHLKALVEIDNLKNTILSLEKDKFKCAENYRAEMEIQRKMFEEKERNAADFIKNLELEKLQCAENYRAEIEIQRKMFEEKEVNTADLINKLEKEKFHYAENCRKEMEMQRKLFEEKQSDAVNLVKSRMKAKVEVLQKQIVDERNQKNRKISELKDQVCVLQGRLLQCLDPR